MAKDEAIADTGYVVAVAVRTDQQHKACLAVHRQQRTIYLLESSLAEIAFMLTRTGGQKATAHFFAGLSASKYQILTMTSEDYLRTSEILTAYADARLDFVDVAIVAVAERLKISRVLTIDRRDFSIIRPKHTDHFEILP